MNASVTVSQMMTKGIITVRPETPLAEVAKIMNETKFNGLPVVDSSNVLVGIVTEYDLIGGVSGIHLPTLQAVLSQLPVLGKDKGEFAEDIESISKLLAKDVMNKDPLTLLETATFDEVLTTFREHHRVNPIPVVDAQKHVVGVVSRYDVLKPLQALQN
jgi:CBS domain-containing protein